MPGITEGAGDDAIHRFVEVGVVIDDDRVLPAHLADHPLDHGLPRDDFRCLLQDGKTDFPTTGEDNLHYIGMPHEGCSHDLAAAGQKGEDARRNARRERMLVEGIGDRIGLLGGLEEHRIPGDQRRRGHAAKDGQRKIPRRDDGAEAPAFIGQNIDLAGQVSLSARGEFNHRLASIVTAEIDRLGDIGIGFAPRLGLFVDLHGGEAKAVPFQPRAQFIDPCRADLQRQVAPGGPGMLGGGDGIGHIGLGGGARAGHNLGPILRHDVEESAALGPGFPVNHHRHGPRHLDIGGGQGLLEKGAGFVRGEVGQRAIFERRPNIGGQLLAHASLLDFRSRFGTGEELFEVGLLVVVETEKALVGGILQKPPHQVGHAGDEIAHRRVEAHPVAEVPHEIALRIGHAVEELDFEIARRDAFILRIGESGGNGTEIVRADGGLDEFAHIEQTPGEFFVSGIGVGFPCEHGAGESLQAGIDDLVIPVGPLDQPRGEGRAPFLRKRDEALDIGRGTLEIGLHHDAEMGPVDELGIEGNALQQAEIDLVEAPLLEVEIDEGARFLCAAHEGNDPLKQTLDAAVGIGFVELMIHRGEFQGNIRARHPAEGAVIEHGGLLPAGSLGGEEIDQVGIAPGIDGGLGLAHGGFAEEIDGEAEALVPELAELRLRLRGILADDELPGHLLHVLLDDKGRDRPGKRIAGRAQRKVHAHGEAATLGKEIVAGVAGDLLLIAQGGEDIDEAEEISLEGGIANGPIHEQALPVGRGKESGGLARQTLVEGAPQPLDIVFQKNIGGVGGGVHG